MQLVSLHCSLFALLLLFVDFSDAKDIVIYANESQISSRPVWNTSIICRNSHYLNLPGDEVALQFVGTRVTINFESTVLETVNVMFALISINNTDVATVNTTRSSQCSPIPWTSDALPQGHHTLRVIQMNHSDHVYIRSFSYITTVGSTLRDELKCYGLPYGALGFLSQLLSLYASSCFINRRKAYFPWSRIEPGKHIFFNAMLCTIAYVAIVSLTNITIARCKNNWQYILLAVGYLSGLLIGIPAISLSPYLDTSKKSHFIVFYLMCIFGFIGGTVGGVGYISLIVQNWSNKNMKIALGTGSVLGIAVGIVSSYVRKLPNFLSVVVFMHIFGLSMTNWVLGAIADDMSGIPHGKIAILIWLSFAVRRLPMLVS